MSFLHIISGSMYSSKSTRLIQLYKELINKYNVLVFNHTIDNRYNNDSNIMTHNRDGINSIAISSIHNILCNNDYKTVDLVMIDECQFFTDLFDNVLHMVEKDNKHVILSGLMTDVNRNFFGDLYKLVPFADKYEQLYSKCNLCSNKGLFTTYVGDDVMDQQINVGSTMKYIPVCRYHYLNRRYSI